jgi:hypothetical protein
MTGKTVMRYSPKYARDGAKIVRCALDQSSKVRDLIRCANYIYSWGCQASGAMLFSPKYARDGARIARCALDQSSKVGALIRCANYIHIYFGLSSIGRNAIGDGCDYSRDLHLSCLSSVISRFCHRQGSTFTFKCNAVRPHDI